jgi:DNA polymerase
MLEALREEASACTRCRLAQTRTQVVFGVGNPQADLMFVGEAPASTRTSRGSRSLARRGSCSTACSPGSA